MHITFPAARKLVRKYADAQPEHVAACTYVHGDQPRCIVGQILVNDCGIDPLRFGDSDSELNDTPLRVLVAIPDEAKAQQLQALLNDSDVTFTPLALQFLGHVQKAQDMAYTWAAALKYGLEHRNESFA